MWDSTWRATEGNDNVHCIIKKGMWVGSLAYGLHWVERRLCYPGLILTHRRKSIWCSQDALHQFPSMLDNKVYGIGLWKLSFNLVRPDWCGCLKESLDVYNHLITLLIPLIEILFFMLQIQLKFCIQSTVGFSTQIDFFFNPLTWIGEFFYPLIFPLGNIIGFP